MTIHEVKLSQIDEDRLAKVSRFIGYYSPDRMIQTTLQDYVGSYRDVLSEKSNFTNTEILPAASGSVFGVGEDDSETISHLIDIHPDDEVFILKEVTIPGLPEEATVSDKASRMMSEFLQAFIEETPESLHPEF